MDPAMRTFSPKSAGLKNIFRADTGGSQSFSDADVSFGISPIVRSPSRDGAGPPPDSPSGRRSAGSAAPLRQGSSVGLASPRSGFGGDASSQGDLMSPRRSERADSATDQLGAPPGPAYSSETRQSPSRLQRAGSAEDRFAWSDSFDYPKSKEKSKVESSPASSTENDAAAYDSMKVMRALCACRVTFNNIIELTGS